MRKLPEVIQVVDALRLRLGDALVVVDHWEGDLAAVGVALRGAAQRLAYVLRKSSPRRPTFYVALELPPEPGSDLPYAVAGDHHDLSLADALDVIVSHLGSSSDANAALSAT